MSNAPTPRHDPTQGSAPGCLRMLIAALMIGVGIVLLLPGACAILFMIGGNGNPLATLGLLISLVGLALIGFGATYEYKRNKARDEIEPPNGLTAGPRTAAMVVFTVLALVAILWLIGWALVRNPT